MPFLILCQSIGADNWLCRYSFLMSFISRSFVQRQKRIAIYHVKKLVKDSQLWKQTLSILPDFLENWHFISHFVWKSTKTLELLKIFDELFDVINGEPFLMLYKTSAIMLKNSTGLWFYISIKSLVRILSKFFDIIKLRGKELFYQTLSLMDKIFSKRIIVRTRRIR